MKPVRLSIFTSCGTRGRVIKGASRPTVNILSMCKYKIITPTCRASWYASGCGNADGCRWYCRRVWHWQRQSVIYLKETTFAVVCKYGGFIHGGLSSQEATNVGVAPHDMESDIATIWEYQKLAALQSCISSRFVRQLWQEALHKKVWKYWLLDVLQLDLRCKA